MSHNAFIFVEFIKILILELKIVVSHKTLDHFPDLFKY